ncbi:MAG: FAD-dependent oxidoreductase [Anaerolineae bacterium]
MASIERELRCDVLVAGGGMAGIAAAIAAAREGARTILVERNGYLGGLGVTGATGLHSFFNIFGASPGAPVLRLVAGIAQELVDRTQALGGAIGHIPLERGGDFVSIFTPVEPETFKLAAFQLCQEAGVRLLLHTIVEDIQATDGHVEGVLTWNKAGRTLIRARQVVDCTGDGDVAAEAGAMYVRFKPGDPGAYSAGYTFRLCNVDLATMEGDLEQRGLITQLAHAVKPGMNRPELVRLGIDMKKLRDQGGEGAPLYFLSTSIRPRELTYCNCINYGPNDGLDVDALTQAEVELRRQMFQVADFFRRHIKGCEESYPAGAAPTAGQRRGRAIRCDYELTREDCTSGRQFEDQIACFGFIDNPRYFVKDGGAYGIPYRALLPVGLDNVLIAGRMMSVDLVAHNSTRNTACCLACGQAAGTAAAMAALSRRGSRDVDVAELQRRLEGAGALIRPQPVRNESGTQRST